MALEFTTTALIPASCNVIYAAWIDSEGHAGMTGAPARCSASVDGSFEAWGGYITGTNLVLTENQQIVQSWRTADFEDDEADSRLEITLEPQGNATRVRIHHSDLPAHGMQYLQGWKEHYFTPMIAHFSA